MRIKLQDEQELFEVCATLLHTLVNVRHSSKKWHEHYGAKLLNTKTYWENRADELLQRLQIDQFDRHEKVKIEIIK